MIVWNTSREEEGDGAFCLLAILDSYSECSLLPTKKPQKKITPLHENILLINSYNIFLFIVMILPSAAYFQRGGLFD